MAERGYRWGKFQGWMALVIAVAQFVLVRFPLSLVVGVLFLYLWTGLLHKRRYGFVLVYVVTGVALLAGLFRLIIEPSWDVFTQVVITVCFWGIPGAFYYPKRYRDFGFGRGKESVATTTEIPKPAAMEVTQAAVASNGGEDAGVIRRVSEGEWREAVARHRVKLMQDERKGKP
jgi:hypothetical protein